MDACLAEQATALANLSLARAAAAAAAPTCMEQRTHTHTVSHELVSFQDQIPVLITRHEFSVLGSLYLQTIFKLYFPYCLPPPLKIKDARRSSGSSWLLLLLLWWWWWWR